MANYILTHTGAEVDESVDVSLSPTIGNEVVSATVNAHVANKNNPHEVTAAQAGAVAKSGDTMTGNLAVPTISNLQGVNSSGTEVSFGGNLKINGTDQVITAANVSTYAVVPNQAAVSGMLAVNKFGDQPDGRIELIRWDGAAFLRNIKADGTYREIVIQQDAPPLYNINSASGTAQNVLLHTGNFTQYAPRFESGTYSGTGRYGSANPCSIAFSFKPKLVFISRPSSGSMTNGMWMAGTTVITFQNGTSFVSDPVDWNENIMTWYSPTNATFQFNVTGETYNYVAFG